MWAILFRELGKFLLRAYGGGAYNLIKAIKGAKKLRKYSKYAKWLKSTKNKHYALFKRRLRKRYIKYILSRIGVRMLKSIPLGRDIYEIITRGIWFYAKKLAYTTLVPVEIRKLIYWLNLFKRMKKHHHKKKNINSTRKKLRQVKRDPSKAIELFYNQDQPENIVNLTKFKPRNDGEKKVIDEILSMIVSFWVKSPERHCFDKAPQWINIKRKLYSVPIAGEIFSKPFRVYQYKLFSQHSAAQYYSMAVKTSNYGREVFRRIRPKSLDYATRKALFNLYNK